MKKQWSAGLDSIIITKPSPVQRSSGRSNTEMADDQICLNADGTPMNEKDAKRIKYLRQRFMSIMGMTNEYVF